MSIEFEEQNFKSAMNREENEENMTEHLENLRNLILQEKDFTSPVDDKFLIQFIRARKYNIERAAKQVRKFWEFVSKLPELVAMFHPSKYQGVIEPLYTVMKTRSNGRQILHVHCGKWETKKLTMDQVFTMGFLVIDHMASTKETQLNGIIIIFDLRDVGITHILSTTPRRIQQIARFIKDSYPLSFKGFYLLYTPAIFQILYPIIKPLLTPKLRKRFLIYGHHFKDQLRDSIGADALPQFFGGNIPNEGYEDMEFYPSLFRRDEHYKKYLSYGFLK